MDYAWSPRLNNDSVQIFIGPSSSGFRLALSRSFFLTVQRVPSGGICPCHVCIGRNIMDMLCCPCHWCILPSPCNSFGLGLGSSLGQLLFPSTFLQLGLANRPTEAFVVRCTLHVLVNALAHFLRHERLHVRGHSPVAFHRPFQIEPPPTTGRQTVTRSRGRERTWCRGRNEATFPSPPFYKPFRSPLSIAPAPSNKHTQFAGKLFQKSVGI